MTLKDLHNEVRAIMFDDCLPMDERFLFSSYRAMREVYNSRKITAEKKFFVRNILPRMRIPEIHHKGNSEEIIPISGKAFSMRLYGSGNVIIDKKGNQVMKDFDCNGDYMKEFIDGESTLTFVGQNSYTVCDLVTFDQTPTKNAHDIPDADGYTVIDLRESLPDFLSLECMPTDTSGNTLENALVFDGKIKFPDSFSGEISLVYRKRPIMPTLDSPDSRIDVPVEYDSLLALLCAAYMLIDDEPEKAALYREEYERMLSVITRNFPYSLECKYIDTNGWA